MICPQCGKEEPDNYVFCSSCNTELSVIETAAQNQHTPQLSAEEYDELQYSAHEGDADAQFELGKILFFGQGVPEDKVRAFSWWLDAADQGDYRAQFSLGLAYDTGNGTPESKERAVLWYTKAAEQGHKFSQGRLANMYMNAQGVQKSYENAAYWFLKLAEDGDAEAQFVLGELYDMGLGVAQSSEQAAYWYNKATAQGYTETQYAGPSQAQHIPVKNTNILPSAEPSQPAGSSQPYKLNLKNRDMPPYPGKIVKTAIVCWVILMLSIIILNSFNVPRSLDTLLFLGSIVGVPLSIIMTIIAIVQTIKWRRTCQTLREANERET